MDRITVKSSNLVSVGYEKRSQILEIEFKEGRIYQYYGVPEREYQDLMKAKSLGTHFHLNIKDKYRYKKIN